jgi:hypothetical protein
MQTEPRQQLESAQAFDDRAGDLVGALQAQEHPGADG